MAKAPGIRDLIYSYLQTIGGEASLDEISRAVIAQMVTTSPSSVRSYLNLNVGKTFPNWSGSLPAEVKRP